MFSYAIEGPHHWVCLGTVLYNKRYGPYSFDCKVAAGLDRNVVGYHVEGSRKLGDPYGHRPCDVGFRLYSREHFPEKYIKTEFIALIKGYLVIWCPRNKWKSYEIA